MLLRGMLDTIAVLLTCFSLTASVLKPAKHASGDLDKMLSRINGWLER